MVDKTSSIGIGTASTTTTTTRTTARSRTISSGIFLRKRKQRMREPPSVPNSHDPIATARDLVRIDGRRRDSVDFGRNVGSSGRGRAEVEEAQPSGRYAR